MQTLAGTQFFELVLIDLEEAIGSNHSRLEFGDQMEGFGELDQLTQLANMDPTLEHVCM